MSNFFNSNDTMRSLVGIFAAVLMGGTFIAAAAGPAVTVADASQANASQQVPNASQQVIVSAESNIVRG